MGSSEGNPVFSLYRFFRKRKPCVAGQNNTFFCAKEKSSARRSLKHKARLYISGFVWAA